MIFAGPGAKAISGLLLAGYMVRMGCTHTHLIGGVGGRPIAQSGSAPNGWSMKKYQVPSLPFRCTSMP